LFFVKKAKRLQLQTLPCQQGVSHALSTWTKIVVAQFPNLSAPQAQVLALWSLGLVLAQACGLSTVALYLGAALGKKGHSIRQRLREFYLEAEAKTGERRADFEVEACFAPLLQWVLQYWEGRQLALGLDATTLGQRFVVLCVSVLYRGCAIPVAWVVLPATDKAAWRPHWLRLLRRLRGVIPRQMRVIVLSDRGLYARWLFQRIRRLGWHLLMRINLGGQFRPDGQYAFVPFKELVPQVGSRFSGVGTAFKTLGSQLRATLLACWEEGYQDPWLLLTDLPPENADEAWYGLRAWIEQGFKLTKRAGWQWQKTRMSEASRASRLWLAVPVATLWLVSVGRQADAALEAATVPDLIAKRRHSGTRWRTTGIFRRGAVLILMNLLNQRLTLIGLFIPEPWPNRTSESAQTKETDRLGDRGT
jgi:Transposase DDE domain